MTLVNPITVADGEAKKPITENLVKEQILENLVDLSDQVDALSGGGGGGGDEIDIRKIATIKAGLIDNAPKFRRKKFSLWEGALNSGQKANEPTLGFDPDSNDENSFWVDIAGNTILSIETSATSYLGKRLVLGKNEKIFFVKKKGVNYFGISNIFSGNSDSVTVTIDGASVTSLGLVDENHTARTDTYSTVTGSSTAYQKMEWFFGLDASKDQYIGIENTDSAVKDLRMDAVDVGFASEDGEYTIDGDVFISAGEAVVRSGNVSLDEATISFPPSTGFGYTGAVKASSANGLEVLAGDEPAFTKATPDIEIDWAAGFTSLQVKNSYYFPAKGFLLLSDPWGNHTIASYTSKTETTPGQNSFDDMLFSAPPKDNWTPLENMSTGSNPNVFNDLSINLWASDSGLEISASNNRIDFNITIAGVETSHSATLNSGLYSADLIPFESEFIRAMNAAKSLASVGGEYFAKWDEGSQKWTLGAFGTDIDAIDFTFNSGPNIASSVHPTLGYADTDIVDGFSYTAGSETQHRAARVLQRKKAHDHTSPNIKISIANGNLSDTEATDIKERLGLGHIFSSNTAEIRFEYYPEKNEVAAALHFMPMQQGNTVTVSTDHGDDTYLMQVDKPHIVGSGIGKIQTGLISFPKGTKVIGIVYESANQMSIDTHAEEAFFKGVTSYTSRPPLERLATTEAIVKCFEIAPLPLFKTMYANSGTGFHSAGTPTKSNLDNVLLTGAWTNQLSGSSYNGAHAFSSTLNNTADFTFTTVADGGGISSTHQRNNNKARTVEYYLVAGAVASETNTLVAKLRTTQTVNNHQGQETFRYLGLPAGQYTLRIKQKDSGSALMVDAVGIYDTIEADPNANVVADLAAGNDDMSISFPAFDTGETMLLDSADKVPTIYERDLYKRGMPASGVHYRILSTAAFSDNDESATSFWRESYYYQSKLAYNEALAYVGWFGFCKAIAHLDVTGSTNSTSIQPIIENRSTANQYSQRVQTLNGSLSTAFDGYYPLFSKNFFIAGSADMSDSITIPVVDTRAMRPKMTVLIKADGQATIKTTLATVVTDTNVTISSAIAGFANYTLANNVSVTFYGRHSIKIDANSGSTVESQGFSYLPMDVSESDFCKRLTGKKVTSVVSNTLRGVANTNNLMYPIHPDGQLGSWRDSSISLIGRSTGSSHGFDDGLENVQVGSGTIDVKITSTREITDEN